MYLPILSSIVSFLHHVSSASHAAGMRVCRCPTSTHYSHAVDAQRAFKLKDQPDFSAVGGCPNQFKARKAFAVRAGCRSATSDFSASASVSLQKEEAARSSLTV